MREKIGLWIFLGEYKIKRKRDNSQIFLRNYTSFSYNHIEDVYLKKYLSYYKVKSQRKEKLSRSDVAGRIVGIGQLPSFSAALFPYHSNFLSNRR